MKTSIITHPTRVLVTSVYRNHWKYKLNIKIIANNKIDFH